MTSPLIAIIRANANETHQLTSQEIRQKAKDSKANPSELRKMVMDADCNEIKDIVLGAVDDNSSDKIGEIVNTLLNELDHATTIEIRSKHIEKLKMALKEIPEELNPFIRNMGEQKPYAHELADLNHLNLDTLLKWKTPLDLNVEFTSKLESLIQTRELLKSKDPT